MAQDYALFIRNVYQKTGIDLSLYKEAQMKRRLKTLRDNKGFHDFHTFYQEMIKNESLFNEFLDRMTINVSEFFRNAKRWEVLEKIILPRLLSENKRLRLWSAACSTGEEPYTLAMILNKFIPFSQISILATDLDRGILERAKVGLYTEQAFKEAPKPMIQKFFDKDPMGYRVKEEVKKTVRFKQHNLLADPFEKNYDLIICRNVMIYFTDEAKNKLYQKFSQALRPGGVLFVGSTEQIINPSVYQLESEEMFFYKKTV